MTPSVAEVASVVKSIKGMSGRHGIDYHLGDISHCENVLHLFFITCGNREAMLADFDEIVKICGTEYTGQVLPRPYGGGPRLAFGYCTRYRTITEYGGIGALQKAIEASYPEVIETPNGNRVCTRQAARLVIGLTKSTVIPPWSSNLQEINKKHAKRCVNF